MNIYVSAERTADFQMTYGIRNILANEGSKNDLIALMCYCPRLTKFRDYL